MFLFAFMFTSILALREDGWSVTWWNHERGSSTTRSVHIRGNAHQSWRLQKRISRCRCHYVVPLQIRASMDSFYEQKGWIAKWITPGCAHYHPSESNPLLSPPFRSHASVEKLDSLLSSMENELHTAENHVGLLENKMLLIHSCLNRAQNAINPAVSLPPELLSSMFLSTFEVFGTWKWRALVNVNPVYICVLYLEKDRHQHTLSSMWKRDELIGCPYLTYL